MLFHARDVWGPSKGSCRVILCRHSFYVVLAEHAWQVSQMIADFYSMHLL